MIHRFSVEENSLSWCLVGRRAARHNNEDGLPFVAREQTDLLNLVNEASEYD